MLDLFLSYFLCASIVNIYCKTNPSDIYVYALFVLICIKNTLVLKSVSFSIMGFPHDIFTKNRNMVKVLAFTKKLLCVLYHSYIHFSYAQACLTPTCTTKSSGIRARHLVVIYKYSLIVNHKKISSTQHPQPLCR